jgi:hypothetical protein
MSAASTTAAPAASPSAIHNQPPGWGRVDARGEAAGATASPATAVAVAQNPWILASFGAEEHCFRRSLPRPDRDLCGQTTLDAESSRDPSRTGFVLSTLTYRDAARAGAGCWRVCAPSIKGRCVDQGRMHAEKRSNHVHSSLIGGEAGGAGSADADTGKVSRLERVGVGRLSGRNGPHLGTPAPWAQASVEMRRVGAGPGAGQGRD